MLKLIRRRRKMRPAGMMRQPKDSLPIRESSSRLRHLLQVDQYCNEASNSDSLSSGKDDSMEVVSITIPRKTRRVVGPSSLSGARGMPNWEAKRTIVWTLSAQTAEFAGPTVK